MNEASMFSFNQPVTFVRVDGLTIKFTTNNCKSVSEKTAITIFTAVNDDCVWILTLEVVSRD